MQGVSARQRPQKSTIEHDDEISGSAFIHRNTVTGIPVKKEEAVILVKACRVVSLSAQRLMKYV